MTTNEKNAPYTLHSVYMNSIIAEVGYFPFVLRKDLNLSEYATFGLEIEFEKSSFSAVEESLEELKQSKQIGSWKLETEATIHNPVYEHKKGGEVISPILFDNESDWQELEKVCSMLDELGSKCYKVSGGHIHLGAQILGEDPKAWLNMFKLWTVYEDVIFRFGYGEQVGPRVSLLENASAFGADLVKIIYRMEREELTPFKICQTLVPRVPNVTKRAFSLNRVLSGTLDDENTIEVRCPNGSINPIVWQNNVNFFAKMFSYCASDDFDTEFVDRLLSEKEFGVHSIGFDSKIDLDSAVTLSELIFSRETDKMYFMKQYLKNFEEAESFSDDIFKKVKI